MLLLEFEGPEAEGHIAYNDELSPKLYDKDDNLHPEVQKTLMGIANHFIEEIDIPAMEIHDVILTGSMANYNYSDYSDIDLHLVTDIDVFADPDMAEKYFKAKKNLWNNAHDVHVRGIDVEVYVEDNDEHNESLGRYSILNDEWLSKPVHDRPVFDRDAVSRKAKNWMKEIDMAVQGDAEEITRMKEKLWGARKEALAGGPGSEYSVGNLTFKVLRNMGYAQKLLDAIADAEDEQLSLSESLDNKELESFIAQWTDNTIGTPPASSSVSVTGEIRISTPRDKGPRVTHDTVKAAMMKHEWRNDSEDLIDELRRAGFGEYELLNISSWHITLGKNSLEESFNFMPLPFLIRKIKTAPGVMQLKALQQEFHFQKKHHHIHGAEQEQVEALIRKKKQQLMGHGPVTEAKKGC